MAYWRIDTFDGLVLPEYNPVQDQSTGAVGSTLQPVAGGVLDLAGNSVRLPVSTPYTVRGIYTRDAASDYLQWITPSLHIIKSANGPKIVFHKRSVNPLGGLRALIGKRAALTRYDWLNPAAKQTVQARLLQVRHRTRQDLSVGAIEVDCYFEAATPFWQELTARSVSALGNPLAVNNDGDAAVTDATLVITPRSGCSSWTVTGGGNHIIYSGSAATSFTLDASKNSVTGGSGYTGVTFGANHDHDGLLRLPAGAFSLAVTGNATLTATLTWKRRYG